MKLKALATALVAAASLAPAAQAAETPLNLLFFGNSYSQGGLPYRLAELAQADGHARPTVLLDSMGGQDLSYHLGEVVNNPQNNVSNPIIAGKKWDAVVMQAHSEEATKFDPGKAVSSYRQDAVNLFSALRNHSSGYASTARAVQLQTWARALGNTQFYPGGYPNPRAMQDDITANTALANGDINAAFGAGTSKVAPVGESFGAFGWSTPLYQTDLHHPSGQGNLLESMVVYRTIYNENVSDISYATWQGVNGKLVTDFAKVDEATWNQLAAAADAVTITVPEPATCAALTTLLISVLGRRRRRRAVR